VSWPADFRQRLYGGGTVSVEIIFEVVLPETGDGVGIPWWAASDPALAADGYVAIQASRGAGLQAPSIGPCSVQPQSWTYQEGAWAVSIHLPESVVVTGGPRSPGRALSTTWGRAAEALRRGVLCRLLIGVRGWARADYQPLRAGRIQAVRCSHPQSVRVEVWDLATALRSRMTPTYSGSLTEQAQDLFYGSCGSTTTASAYVAGSSTSLNVTSLSAFNRETTGVALLTGNSGTQFYVTYTGTSTGPNRLTGVSTIGYFETVAENAASGNAIQAVPYLSGHPVSITRKLLTSTGAGTNGGFDTYPEAWGLGIDTDWLDSPDLAILQQSVIRATGVAYGWTVLPEAAQPDPWAWWSSYLSAAGIWICTRQGQVVMRCARDPNTATELLAEALTDADLVHGEAPEVSWYAEETPEAYCRYKAAGIATTSGGSNSSVTTLPARGEWISDLGDVLAGQADEEGIRDEVAARCAPWVHLTPETISLTVTGLRGYAPGDVLPLTLSGVRGRLSGTRQGYSERPALVLSEAPDLARNRTRLTLAVLPTGLEEDGA
jgi:hypothetical protein